MTDWASAPPACPPSRARCTVARPQFQGGRQPEHSPAVAGGGVQQRAQRSKPGTAGPSRRRRQRRVAPPRRARTLAIVEPMSPRLASASTSTPAAQPAMVSSIPKTRPPKGFEKGLRFDDRQNPPNASAQMRGEPAQTVLTSGPHEVSSSGCGSMPGAQRPPGGAGLGECASQVLVSEVAPNWLCSSCSSRDVTADAGLDALAAMRPAPSSRTGCSPKHRGRPDLVTVDPWPGCRTGVDHHVHQPAGWRPPRTPRAPSAQLLEILAHHLMEYRCGATSPAVPSVASTEPDRRALHGNTSERLSRLATDTNTGARGRQRPVGGGLALGQACRKSRSVCPHRWNFISGPSSDHLGAIGFRSVERQHGFLHRDRLRRRGGAVALGSQHTLRTQLGDAGAQHDGRRPWPAARRWPWTQKGTVRLALGLASRT